MNPNNDIVINVHNLNKSFNGIHAVRDVDLMVKKGEIFGFLGPNGSGKTTTIRMLCGLLTPDSGSGQCLGFDVIRQSAEIKSRSGYMTQTFGLYTDLTVFENLDFMARLYKLKNRVQLINDILAEFNLVERRNQLAGTLSGGLKQRLALTASLLHKPQLLLLDEPTAGVDPKSRRDFWDTIYHLSKKGVTTLVSTHYMDEAERCTKLAYILKGKIVAQGDAKEIIENSKLSTWKITAKNIYELEEKFYSLPGVDQVVIFGNNLHVSGSDTLALKNSVQQLKDNYDTATETGPSLEDIFISLVKSKDQN